MTYFPFQGWHVSGQTIELTSQTDGDEIGEKLEKWAPYLMWIHKLMKHGNWGLNLTDTETGTKYLNYLEQVK